jgi:hypothetical protein
LSTDEQDFSSRSRVVDTTDRDARSAIKSVITECGPLRERVAMITFKALRPLSNSERADLVDDCKGIEQSIHAARTTLILALMDAPRRVLANSRVADVEKALDNLETSLAAALTALARSG